MSSYNSRFRRFRTFIQSMKVILWHQRIRCTPQWIHVYTQIVKSSILASFIKSCFKHPRLVWAATVFTGAQMPNDMIESHSEDLNEIDRLKKALACQNCGGRHTIDQTVEGIRYCKCEKKQNMKLSGKVVDDSEWMPFLERPQIIVWRKEHPKHPGMFIYKMYGAFDNMSAEEFLATQLDVSEFRKSWDVSTVQCYVLEETRTESTMNQVYYWEVKWPKFFSNRDYVCNRRVAYMKDLSIVYTTASEHPKCPENPNNYRVDEYLSIMTISANRKSGKGIEFSLTAFENPGVSIPSSIVTWVAIRGLPEYIMNLQKACIERRKYIKYAPSKSCPSQEQFLPSYSNAYA